MNIHFFEKTTTKKRHLFKKMTLCVFDMGLYTVDLYFWGIV